MTGRRRVVVTLGLAVMLAGALTLTGTRLAAPQGTTLTALAATGHVPADHPFDGFWARLTPVEVPLSAQNVTPPMGGHRWTLRVRAVHDDRNLYVEVEWPDRSRNAQVAAPQEFTDAVAVQFPAIAGERVPAFCMGDPAATVNIWQWKAAWQEAVQHGFGGVRARYPRAISDWYPFHDQDVFYPGRYVGNPFSVAHRTSAVDNLVAGGFGTLTPDPTPVVTGAGEWLGGRWGVVFARPLVVNRDGNTEFSVGDSTDVAFAVWDGSAQERDGQKSVANFVTLDISSAAIPAKAGGWPYWPLPFVLFMVVWVVFAAMIIPRTREG